MPRSFALFVEVLLDVGGYVLLDVVLVHCQTNSSFRLLLEVFWDFRDQHLDLSGQIRRGVKMSPILDYIVHMYSVCLLSAVRTRNSVYVYVDTR